MRTRALHLVVACALVLGGACTGGGSVRVPSSPSPEYWRGGTLRVGMPGDLPSVWDPQQSYWAGPWEVFRCCLLRTLFSYNGHSAEEGGAILRPDLAGAMPEPAPDGLSWTFHMKAGLTYAPPFEDTEILAADIVRALIREADPDVTTPGFYIGGYPGYYSVIRGFDDVRAGRAATITGLEIPDDHTLVVRLTEPAADLPYRFALPAAAPIPEGAARGHDRDYERFLVASGPYMIEGSGDLDFSVPPAEQEPVSGYTPSTFGKGTKLEDPGTMSLVRNPSWASESDGLRHAYVDRIEIKVFDVPPAENDKLVALVNRDELDVLLEAGISTAIQRARSDPELAGRLLTEERPHTGYISLNLARPPFDDAHVRRAVAYAVDREAFVRLLRKGGVTGAELATHIGPNVVEGGLLAAYDPFPEHGGDLAAARREMALSRYDHDGDGRCDDPACRDIPAVGFSFAGGPLRDLGETSLVRENVKPIGLDLDVRLLVEGDFYEEASSGRAAIAISAWMNWATDWPTGMSFFVPVFGGSSVGDPSSINTTLMGATPAQLRAMGLEPVQVPSVDDRIARCSALAGSAQESCWAELDQYLMEEIVPAVPTWVFGVVTLVSPRVAHASIDVWGSNVALDQVALVEGSG